MSTSYTGPLERIEGALDELAAISPEFRSTGEEQELVGISRLISHADAKRWARPPSRTLSTNASAATAGRRAGSILGVTVIVVSFFESVFADHSKDHPMAVAHVGSDTGSADASGSRQSWLEGPQLRGRDGPIGCVPPGCVLPERPHRD
jgi:hypothetical protein